MIPPTKKIKHKKSNATMPSPRKYSKRKSRRRTSRSRTQHRYRATLSKPRSRPRRTRRTYRASETPFADAVHGADPPEAGHDASITHVIKGIVLKVWKNNAEGVAAFEEELTNHQEALKHSFLHAPVLYAHGTDPKPFLAMEEVNLSLLTQFLLKEERAAGVARNAIAHQRKRESLKRLVHGGEEERDRFSFDILPQLEYDAATPTKAPRSTLGTPVTVGPMPPNMETAILSMQEQLQGWGTMVTKVAKAMQVLFADMCEYRFLHFDLKLDNMFAVTDSTGKFFKVRVFDFEFCKHGQLNDDDYLNFLYSTLTGCVHEFMLIPLAGGVDGFRDLHTKLHDTVSRRLTSNASIERATSMLHDFEVSLGNRVSF